MAIFTSPWQGKHKLHFGILHNCTVYIQLTPHFNRSTFCFVWLYVDHKVYYIIMVFPQHHIMTISWFRFSTSNMFETETILFTDIHTCLFNVNICHFKYQLILKKYVFYLLENGITVTIWISKPGNWNLANVGLPAKLSFWNFGSCSNFKRKHTRKCNFPVFINFSSNHC